VIPHQQLQGRLELLKAWKNTIVAAEIMVYHITKMKNGIQVQRIKRTDATVKFGKREPVLPGPVGQAIAILAIGKDTYPDDSSLLGLYKWDIQHQEKVEE
jgi:hypothetical protein